MTTWQYWLLIGLFLLHAYMSERRYEALVEHLDQIREVLDGDVERE